MMQLEQRHDYLKHSLSIAARLNDCVKKQLLNQLYVELCTATYYPHRERIRAQMHTLKLETLQMFNVRRS